MDTPRSSILADSHSRRSALRTTSALAAGLVAVGLSRAGTQAATPIPAVTGTGIVFVQTFGSGSLFPTQGSGPNLPPYTLYVWEAGEHTIFVTGEPERIAGLIPSDRFFDEVMDADTPAFTAVLVASTAGDAASTDDDAGVWMLKVAFAGVGSDPGSLTYQGDLVSAAEAEAQLGLTPSPAPNGAENLPAGTLFVTGVTTVELGDVASVRLHLP